VAAVRAVFFHTYSTSTITARAAGPRWRRSKAPAIRCAHLLALAAHLESLRVYKPPPSAVGCVPMTDPAYAERTLLYPGNGCRGYRLRVHRPYTRAVPSHAIELAAVYLDTSRGGSCPRPDAATSPQQEADLRRIHPSCGAGPASASCAVVSDDGRRALRRHLVRGIFAKSIDKRPVSALLPTAGLASNGCVTAPAHSISSRAPC